VYSRGFSQLNDWEPTMLSSSESDGGGFKDAILEVKGISASKESVCQRNQCTKGIGCLRCVTLGKWRVPCGSGCLWWKLAVVSMLRVLIKDNISKWVCRGTDYKQYLFTPWQVGNILPAFLGWHHAEDYTLGEWIHAVNEFQLSIPSKCNHLPINSFSGGYK